MYEAAPIAFKVTVLPKQIAVDVELAINVGVGVTENEIVVVETQPNPFTPYGKSKLLAEKYIQEKLIDSAKKFYIIRPCMIPVKFPGFQV